MYKQNVPAPVLNQQVHQLIHSKIIGQKKQTKKYLQSEIQYMQMINWKTTINIVFDCRRNYFCYFSGSVDSPY